MTDNIDIQIRMYGGPCGVCHGAGRVGVELANIVTCPQCKGDGRLFSTTYISLNEFKELLAKVER